MQLDLFLLKHLVAQESEDKKRGYDNLNVTPELFI